MIGEAAALGSAAFWALGTVLMKGLTQRLSATFIMAARTAVAASFCILIVLVTVMLPDGPKLSIEPETLAVLVGSGLIALTGDLTLLRALAIEDVSRAFTISTGLYIIFSVAGGIVFTGEPFSPFLIPGGVAVLVGTRLLMNKPEAEPASTTRTRQPVQALWLCLLASLLWSSSLLIVSEAMQDTDPFSATVLRMPILGAAFLLMAIARRQVKPAQLIPADYLTLVVAGGLVLCAMLLFLVSAKYASSGSVAILTSTSPIFVVPLAYLFEKEQLTWRLVSGTAVSMLGIWLAVL